MRHATIPVGEVHSYAADGSFAFSRAAQNRGDVVSFVPSANGEHFDMVVRYSEEDALQLPPGAGAARWRPGLALCADGIDSMRTSQLIHVVDSSVPPDIPAEDELGVLNVGSWTVVAEES